MRATLLTLASLLAASTCSLRGDETLEDIRRQMKVAAEKFEVEIRSDLDEAAKIAQKQPRQAVFLLELLEVRLMLDRVLTTERRKDLLESVAKRLQEYRKQAGIEPP